MGRDYREEFPYYFTELKPYDPALVSLPEILWQVIIMDLQQLLWKIF